MDAESFPENVRSIEKEDTHQTDTSSTSRDLFPSPESALETDTTKFDPEKQEIRLEDKVPRDINGWKWGLVVTAILFSIFLYAPDATIVADIQPAIEAEFDSLEKLTWLSVAFLLGATSTNLLWGKIYGQFNAKWTYICCVAFFEVGSAICGVSCYYCSHGYPMKEVLVSSTFRLVSLFQDRRNTFPLKTE